MIEYSKKYPDLIFSIHGVGDATEDMWYAYYYNGQVQNDPARIEYDGCKFFKND
jgi:hypothetical protein